MLRYKVKKKKKPGKKKSSPLIVNPILRFKDVFICCLVCVCECGHVHTMPSLWRLEHNPQELLLSFYRELQACQALAASPLPPELCCWPYFRGL